MNPLTSGSDLGDGAAEVEPQPDLFGQSEGFAVGGDERVEVGKRGGRDGDSYVTGVELLRGGDFGEHRLIRSAAGNERLHHCFSLMQRLTYTSIGELLSVGKTAL